MKKLAAIFFVMGCMIFMLHAQNSSSIPNIGIGGDTTTGSLPVKLIILTVRQSIDDAIINWQTASEINSDYFEVQRATQCAPCNEQSWVALGRLKGSGNTTDIRSYQFIDKKLSAITPATPTLYYRLKQVDKNGEVTNSNIIVLDIKTKLNTITLYPLPINNVLTAVSSNSENVSELAIFDMSGKEIFTSNGSQIDVSILAQGMYVVRVITDKQTYIQKITK